MGRFRLLCAGYLDLMFESAQSHPPFRLGIKTDDDRDRRHADMQYRGVIEGFYGWPWSLEDRMSFGISQKRYKLELFCLRS